MYTKSDLFAQLDALHIPRDRGVLMHSSLRLVGQVEGGALTLLRLTSIRPRDPLYSFDALHLPDSEPHPIATHIQPFSLFSFTPLQDPRKYAIMKKMIYPTKIPNLQRRIHR